jgi:hypothetical protein
VKIPATHKLTALETSLLDALQLVLRSGPYPAAIRELLSKIKRRSQ